ncbi:conserved Plasmodium protein, unknown function [Plasmodium gallinaceum]|uniref:Translation initiation factor eIF2B subunit epsilon n=1 Tax=Plasmodium gallinaceum TaxID=5849 RepID=A0A1J1GYR8_PLAGA|nr:conserved Plasmodium protein, unknown function [Plasmodium gallinaceum]CRG97708.1 conserved Plasmodium protein, unknown function [Plasmodium gallinaceum]
MKKEIDFNICYGEEKQNLIGLLIENNFDDIYDPLTTESLRFFLPLNGVCLIDFQLHFFKQNNIKKIYVVVTHHEKELLNYIEKFQKSKKKYSDLDIEVIKMNKKIKTLGDALRDFKKCVEIYNDILLLLSDTVPVANIKEIIKAHFTNKEKCKNQIMTLILSHYTYENRSLNDDYVIAYDNFTFKLLLFEPLKNKNNLILTKEILNEINTKEKKNNKNQEKNLNINSKESTNNSHNQNTLTDSIRIAYDLTLPNIFIITPQVFKLFEDNFDYQCMRKDFIYNILNQEIKLEEIYVHELNDDYNYTECNNIITTLSDFRIYFNFFKKLIERNVHPFFSNANYLLPEFPKVIYNEPGVYKSKNVIIDHSCKLLKIVLIESHSEILENSTIENSVIGKNCKIGKNVRIVNSIIGRNSIIKDNVVILSSYISENVIINDNVFIDECCIIGKNMNIPCNIKINKYMRLSVYKYLKEKMKLKKNNEKEDLNKNMKRENDENKNNESNFQDDLQNKENHINQENNNCNILNSEPFEINNYIVKTKYSDDQLRLFSLIGNLQNYLNIKIPCSSSDNDSLEESDYSDYSVSKNNKTISDDNISCKEDEINNDSVNIDNVNNYFSNINEEKEKNSFTKEICILCKEALEKPQFMSHKILEMKSFRLSLNYTDLDVIISFFPVVWEFINKINFDKNTWVESFDNSKLDLLFSSFILDNQLYYETIYDLILNFSKKQFLTNNIKNNIYGSDKLCNAFEYIYHSDIFEFNYFNEWMEKNGSDDYLKNNERLKAFAKWLSEE